MRIALIADIHGNIAALDAVLAAIEQERPDEIVCLGDVAAMGPRPHETLHRLRALGCPVVMGNADAELLDPSGMPADSDDARKFCDMTAWAAAQLDAADRAFIASFRSTVEIALSPQRRLLCCHGSPRSFDDVIVATTPDDDLAPMLSDAAAATIAGGHTHVRMLRLWRGQELINPGSVGLAYEFLPDGAVRVPPWAEFAIALCNDAAVEVSFRRVPYDLHRTVRAIHESGLPHAAWWTADWQ